MAHIKFVLLATCLVAKAAAEYSGGSGVSETYGAPAGGDFGGGYSGGFSGGDFGHGGGGYSAGGEGGGYGGHEEEHHQPQPYEFGYAVKDHHHGTDFGQQESSDGHNVKGQYRVVLPDGRTQIVTYHADWKTGFHADVKYEGEAHYPEPSSHGGNGGNGGGYSYPAPSDYTSADFGHSAGGYRR